MIKYTNQSGEEISENDILKLSYYSKIFYADNKLIKEETYINGRLADTSYPVTTIDEINNKLIQEPNASFNLIYFRNGYRIEEMHCYDNKILIDKTISVYNSQNELIGYRKYKVENGVFISFTTDKYYYQNNEEKYEFEYHKNGECFMVYDMQVYQSDIFASKIGNTDYTDFSWVGFEYYKNADPIIPDLDGSA